MNTKELMLTPPEIAKRWGFEKNADKVIAFIRSGELKAVNLAIDPNGKRPRYRVALSEVERFEEVRSTKAPPPKQRRRRRRDSLPTGKEYF